MAQQIIVIAVVIAAALFATWKLMPARRRLQALLALDAWCARHPHFAGMRERALKPRIARAAGSGCDGCGESHTHHRPR